MVKSVAPWTPSCNGSIRVELDGQRATSDSGALLLREALDSSGVIEAMESHLVDPRDPSRIRYSLASQLRTLILQGAMGWFDLSDTTTLRHDVLWNWPAVRPEVGSGRREDYSPRPPTPPYVRFRIRRFMKND